MATVWVHFLNYHLLIMGVIIVLVVLFLPGGLAQFVRERLRLSFATRRGAMTMLALRDVSAGYGAVDVLSDIDLDVHPGEWLAIVGAPRPARQP